MARSLAGKTFFTSYNNGVTTITSEEILRNREKVGQIREALQQQELRAGGLIPRDDLATAAQEGLRHIPKVPIFTFSDMERHSRSPWLSGNFHLENAVIAYIEEEGGKCKPVYSYVPFSNGTELGLHGPEAMCSELRYVTTETQFRDTFGIGPREVEEWHAKKQQGEGVPNRF